MDFFDKLSKKVGEVYQGAKTKTEEVSQEFKLKSEISKRKAAIEKIYAEIGMIVYEDIKDNKDVSRDVVESKCSEITANNEEIARLEAEILKVKSIRVCEKCNAEIDYKITIQTYHLIPTTIKLYDTNDGNRELLLTCNESAQRDEEYKINCVSDDYTLYYSSNDEDNYEVEVIFDSTDAEGNPWSQDYSELLDFIDIKIDSWQKTN